MINQFKYRFIGAIVLLALIVIFAPMLFHSMVHYRSVKPANPPLIPQIAVASTPKKPEITPPPATLTKNLSPLKAYAIQVASLKKPARIEALLLSLQKDDLKAYSYKPKNSPYTAVYVGPVLTKQKAEGLLAVIEKEYKLTGLVKNYNPQMA